MIHLFLGSLSDALPPGQWREARPWTALLPVLQWRPPCLLSLPVLLHLDAAPLLAPFWPSWWVAHLPWKPVCHLMLAPIIPTALHPLASCSLERPPPPPQPGWGAQGLRRPSPEGERP